MQVEERVWVFRHHVIYMQDALSVGLVKGLYKARVQAFIADPGGKNKGKTSKSLPGFGQVIYIRRYLPLFQRTVAYDHSCGRAFDMLAKILSRIDEYRADPPIFLDQVP